MENNKICRLCLKACKANFLPVKEIAKGLLGVLGNMDLNISKSPIMCKECLNNLEKCFEFKSVCILTEENVIAGLESSHLCKTNMTQMYLKDVKKNFPVRRKFVLEDGLWKMEEVCRFCTKPVTKFFTIDKLDKDINFSNMLQKFLPEVKLSVINNPVSCNNCLNTLKSYFTFLKNCQDVEDYIKAYCNAGTETTIKVDLNNVVQYMLKHIKFQHVAENSISRLKKDVIDDVTITKYQSVGRYSSDPVKTELQQQEQIIEMNSTELICMDAITTKDELEEIFPLGSAVSVPDSMKKCSKKKISTKDLLLEEIKNERSDDNDVFSGDSSEENNSENVDMTKIKMEDIDIKCNNIDVERENERCDDNIFSEGSTDENNTEDLDMTKIKMEDIDITSNKIDVERFEEKSKKLQCPNCNYQSSCRSNLTCHLKSIHGDPLLSCHHCGYKTHSEDFLKKHQMIHGENAKFEKVFSSRRIMEDQVLRKHDNPSDIVTSKIHLCNICNFKTTKKSDLFLHINTKHSRLEKYQCNYCLRSFNHKGNLKKHVSSVHLNLRPYICKDCKKTFDTKINLESHIVSRHQENSGLMKTVTYKIYNCDHCTYRCVQNRTMKNHIKTRHVMHSNNTKLKCPQSQKVFNSKINIENHILKKHDNLCEIVTSKVHLCKICDFKTINKSHLFRHINSKHSRLEKYQCYYCLYSFNDKDNLKNHISSIHLNLRPYICKGCKKTFKRKSTLDCHIVSCHQENSDLMKTVTNKIIQCDHCAFKCLRNKVMKNHIKTHDKHV